MIDQKLLEILACPLCKTEVKLKEKNGQEYLVCIQCKRMYPIRDGIPIMLIDEAIIENTKSDSSD
ncbi:MAG TPA: hypothetical protein DHV62_04585 [Elusimicrobia bacterium]|nr:hypothetical protein [Elusimicrobiota bacterium]